MSDGLNESTVEQFALANFSSLGYNVTSGSKLSLGEEPEAHRTSYSQVILSPILWEAIARINPHLPADAQQEVFNRVLRLEPAGLLEANRLFHRYLTEGVDVEYRDATTGELKYAKAYLLDYTNSSSAAAANNHYLAVNQFEISAPYQSQGGSANKKRPDLIVFVNGLPLAVFEFKNPFDQSATVAGAYNQLQNYQTEIPDLFRYNAVLVISDGLTNRVGALTTGFERFQPWRALTGEEEQPLPDSLETLIKGVFTPDRLLDILRYFVVFEQDSGASSSGGSTSASSSSGGGSGSGTDTSITSAGGTDNTNNTTTTAANTAGIVGMGGIRKKIAAYHQYFAANKAVAATIKASTIFTNSSTSNSSASSSTSTSDNISTSDTSGSSSSGGQGLTPQEKQQQEQARGRAGIVWHTQGSGKSLTMVFYAGKLVQQPPMQNPTLVVLTDRNDLDDQLLATFSGCRDLLRQTPVQATDRAHLRELLTVKAGGIIFTTIQKFAPDKGTGTGTGTGERNPALSLRHNIVFIADEAHRSQYNFRALTREQTEAEEAEATTKLNLSYGLAQHIRDALPNATYIGFTGTPVETADRSTRRVFGDILDTYDISRSIADKATVPIYYEAHLLELGLDDTERPEIDPDFEEVTEGQERDTKEKLKTRWSSQEAIAGTPARLEKLAAFIVGHFEERLKTLSGKAMIVGMSRDICVALYNEIVKLRPQWHSPDDGTGEIKVVITGASDDPPELHPHIRSKRATKAIANRFKNPADPLRLVIVRDMWLTGFDVPALHTMYIDKPMRDHNLMQAIARVNRVYLDKPGGLIVDCIGISTELHNALERYNYSANDKAAVAVNQELAVAKFLEQLGILRDLFHTFDYSAFATASPTEKFRLVLNGFQHVYTLPPLTVPVPVSAVTVTDGTGTGTNGSGGNAGNGSGGGGNASNGNNGQVIPPDKRFLNLVAALSKAYTLSIPNERALAHQEEVAFFQAIRQSILKTTVNDTLAEESADTAVRQIVHRAVAAEGVMDIFRAAGISLPNVAIFDERFLAQAQALPQRNVAIEALRKLLRDEIKARSRRNTLRYRSFERKLDEAINRYNNQAIDAAALMQELIETAREMRAKAEEGQALNLSEEELAFYDALAANDSAVEALGNEELYRIARELVETVRKNVTLDWHIKESVRARLRVMIKRLLSKHGYPPDRRDDAIRTVLDQAHLLGMQPQ